MAAMRARKNKGSITTRVDQQTADHATKKKGRADDSRHCLYMSRDKALADGPSMPAGGGAWGPPGIGGVDTFRFSFSAAKPKATQKVQRSNQVD